MVIKINGCEVQHRLHKINSKLQKPIKRHIWKDSRLLGIVAPTLSTLLHFSPEMKLAYIVVCGVGMTLVSVGLIENVFISIGNTRTAEIIERITKGILLAGTSIGIGYFIFNAPMWHWGR
ncbi:hypothetical protein IHV10_06460 [Fictibacillus sp. 5RED26]|uniref:hypothetical protein n=1 Tax=Fictibacillus sp. 5RED26 TaxID=2745876 RepID=UPI0018CCC440|nr:hypothetical protein [Fictibacillus sp. 5RED26]MBH0156005.1 hypothetical protein [Fictibacillus sp. 5RED26]